MSSRGYFKNYWLQSKKMKTVLFWRVYILLQDEILPWFEKTKRKEEEKKKKKKRKLPLRVLNSKWKVSRSRIGFD